MVDRKSSACYNHLVTTLSPAIQITSAHCSDQRWITLQGLEDWEIEERIEEIFPSGWILSGFCDLPSFLCSPRASLEDLADYSAGLQESRQINLPENVYATLCQEHGAVLAPGNIALFGDGSVETDADIARAVAEAYGGLGEMIGEPSANPESFDWERYGAELRQLDGCLLIDGYVAQKT